MLKRILALCICFATFFLTGCYDNDEIDTLAVVMAVGVEEGDVEGKKLYTFAVSDVGGYKSDSSGDGASLICYSQEATNVKSAVNAIDRKISKRLSFSHMSALLFSVETASKGLYADIGYFEADYKVRPQVMISLMDISPGKYLEGLDPELEANPEKYFQRVFQRSDTFVAAMRLVDFTNSYHCGKTVLAPVISGNPEGKKITEQDAFIVSSALISGGKYVFGISDNPFVGLFFSDKKVTAGGKELRSVELPRVDVDISGEKPRVMVDLYVGAPKGADVASLAKEGESFLKSCYSKDLDIINVSGFAKKKFVRLSTYSGIDWKDVLRNADFRVKINVVSGGVD